MSLDRSAPNNSVSLRHAHAAEMKLPAPQPKPTSSSSQLESAVSLWDGGPTVTGVSECGPGEFTADRSRTTEVRHIISGSGIVTGEEGVGAEVGPGSLQVLPQGWCGTWVVCETIRKPYVIVGD